MIMNNSDIDFLKGIQEQMISRLEDLKNEDVSLRVYEVPAKLIEDELNAGSWYSNALEPKIDISNHYAVFDAMYTHLKDTTGVEYNPFEDPEGFHLEVLKELFSVAYVGAIDQAGLTPSWDSFVDIDNTFVEKVKEGSEHFDLSIWVRNISNGPSL